MTSLSEIPPTAACTTCTRTSSVDSLVSDGHQGFLRTLHVGLDDKRQCLRTFADVVEHRFQLGGLLASQLDVAELALAEQRDFARLALVGSVTISSSPAAGTSVRPWISTGIGRSGAVDGLAVFVEHGADPAEAGAGQYRVAAIERAA